MNKHQIFLNHNRHRYDELVEEHGSETCFICGASPKTRKLHLDHDHHTMTIRGLLCFRCNSTLSSWIDADWLRAAADYLADSAD